MVDSLHLVLISIIGSFAGLFASSTGSGSLITLPLLIFFGLPIHAALATNRLAVVALEVASAAKFHAHKQLPLGLALRLGGIAAAGALIGSRLSYLTDEKTLTLLTAILSFLVTAVVIFKGKLGLEERTPTRNHLLVLFVATFGLGIYGGFFGPGFGTFMSFTLVLTGYTFIKSAAISRVVGALMSGTSALYFAYLGLIQYEVALFLGIGLAVGGWFGASLGLKKGNTYIRIIFTVIVMLSAGKLLFDYFSH